MVTPQVVIAMAVHQFKNVEISIIASTNLKNKATSIADITTPGSVECTLKNQIRVIS